MKKRGCRRKRTDRKRRFTSTSGNKKIERQGESRQSETVPGAWDCVDRSAKEKLHLDLRTQGAKLGDGHNIRGGVAVSFPGN